MPLCDIAYKQSLRKRKFRFAGKQKKNSVHLFRILNLKQKWTGNKRNEVKKSKRNEKEPKIY